MASDVKNWTQGRRTSYGNTNVVPAAWNAVSHRGQVAIMTAATAVVISYDPEVAKAMAP